MNDESKLSPDKRARDVSDFRTSEDLKGRGNQERKSLTINGAQIIKTGNNSARADAMRRGGRF